MGDVNTLRAHYNAVKASVDEAALDMRNALEKKAATERRIAEISRELEDLEQQTFQPDHGRSMGKGQKNMYGKVGDGSTADGDLYRGFERFSSNVESFGRPR